MTLEGDAKLVRIFIGESDNWNGRPLSDAIVHEAREMGLAGATVLRGIEGFGARSVLHTARVLRLSEDLPIVIEVVDSADNLAAFPREMQRDGQTGSHHHRERAHRQVSGGNRAQRVTVLGVVIGGGLGALARYQVGGVVSARQRSSFPYGTLVVNVLGSLALGLLVGLVASGRLDDRLADLGRCWFLWRLDHLLNLQL